MFSPMRITIVTTYNPETGDTMVGAIAGSLTQDQKNKLREGFKCPEDDGQDFEEVCQMFFREVNVVDEPDGLTFLSNIDGEHIE